MKKCYKVYFGVLALVALVFYFLINSDLYLFTDREGNGLSVSAPITLPVENVPMVFEQLERNQKEGSWAAFAFCPPNSPCTELTSVNLQYSIENGAIGLDWVLLSPRNISDKDRIISFIEKQGHGVLKREENNVSYLRVEDGDLVSLGTRIIEVFYRLGSDDKMDLFLSGFEYTKKETYQGGVRQ